jgi:phosphoglycolate phosphatase-like HAD superfamily hydrolase
MTIRLIAIDVDGTLVTSSNQVTKATRSSQIGMEIAVDDIHLEKKD